MPACELITATSPDGARVGVCQQGGQVMSWVPAQDAERLWVSPLAECGPDAAVRGGIPVIFPQFSTRGTGPRHGIARNRPWQVRAVSGGTSIHARLTHSASTLEQWPGEFELLQLITATGNRLQILLSARNTGFQPWAFSAALHTYLRVSDPATVIHGLGGHTGEDNTRNLEAFTLEQGPLPATAARDWAVRGVGGPVTLEDPELGTVQIEASGFSDRVVWNPGHPAPGDIPEAEVARFCCIEPAELSLTTLQPGDSWNASLVMTAGATGSA